MEDENRASRFAYLLQPIKDLAKNWDIDIARELEGYLDELAELSQAVEGQNGQMNFAEAALLIQGSTFVYSKKVEYLYQLVLQTLEVLANKKKLATKKDAAQDGDAGDEDGAGERDHDDVDDFLDLNNLKEALNIVLTEDLGRTEENRRLILPPMPMSLIPLEDFEKMDVPLVARNGEVLGKKDDFRINSCYIHPTGTLLLDLANAQLLVDHPLDTPFVQDDLDQTLTPSGDHPISSAISPEKLVNAPSASFEPGLAEGSLCGEEAAGFEDVEDYTGGAEGDDGALEHQRDADNRASSAATLLGPDGEQQRGSVSLLRAANRGQPGRGSVITDADSVDLRMSGRMAEPARADRWATRDPYDATGDARSKAAKKGRTTRMPDVVRQALSRKRKWTEAAEEGTMRPDEQRRLSLEWVSDFINYQFYSYRRHRQFPKADWRAPAWPALDYVFWAVYKRRQEARKRLRALNPAENAPSTEDEAETEDEEAPEGFDDADDDDDQVGGFQPAPEDNEDELDLDEHLLGNGLAALPNVVLDMTGGLDRPATCDMNYEQLVQHYIERYLSTAQHQLSTTALSRRVQQWEDRLLPALRAEDKRRPFDIHSYGSEVLESLGEVGNERRFAEVVTEKPDWEVCRYFLASLIMANTYNVRVGPEHTEERRQTNAMTLKLLSLERHHEQFM